MFSGVREDSHPCQVLIDHTSSSSPVPSTLDKSQDTDWIHLPGGCVPNQDTELDPEFWAFVAIILLNRYEAGSLYQPDLGALFVGAKLVLFPLYFKNRPPSGRILGQTGFGDAAQSQTTV